MCAHEIMCLSLYANVNLVCFHVCLLLFFLSGTLRVWELDLPNRKIRPTECQTGQLKRIVKCLEVSENHCYCRFWLSHFFTCSFHVVFKVFCMAKTGMYKTSLNVSVFLPRRYQMMIVISTVELQVGIFWKWTWRLGCSTAVDLLNKNSARWIFSFWFNTASI